MRATSPLALAASFLGLFVTPALAQDALDLIKQAKGQWEGGLTYRDYSSGERFTIPAEVEISIEPGGERVLRRLNYTDPGSVVAMSEMLTVSEDNQTLSSAFFSGRGVELSESRIQEIAEQVDGGWQIVTLGTENDGGAPADVRLTIVFALDRLIQTKEVRPAGNENQAWQFRNEIVLDRVARDDAGLLLGSWDVDLRPSPDAPPSIAPMTIKSVDNGTLAGSFYGTPIESGRVNTLWGSVQFAFVTSDGSGPYATFGVVQPDGTIKGMTLSTGRDFLSVWSAEESER